MTRNKTADRVSVAIRRAVIITGAFLATALMVQAQQSEVRKPGDTASCLRQAAQMNEATIKFGQLASQKAQNPELKQFGEQMEKDHKRAQTKLESIAKNHDIVLPTTLDAKCQEELTKLQGLTGSDFDKEFAKGAIQGHATAIAHLRKAAAEAQDSDVAQYAKDRLAQMQRHQEKAREVAKAVGLDQTTIAALETQPPEGVGTAGGATQTESGGEQKTEQGAQKDSQPQP